MLKRLIAALVLTSAVALAPVAASAAEDKMEHKEMNMEKNHVKREHRHHKMRHHGMMEHHHHHHHHDTMPDMR